MKISSKANFHLRPASPADHENFTSKKLFVTAFEWMKKKICKLVRCVQKVLKPRQTRVKISRSQIERARTSENGTRKKLTDCASSKEASNNERQACCSDFHKLERITRNVRSLKRYPNETISSFNISCTPANYFETFQQQRADLHPSTNTSPQKFCLIQWCTYRLEGYCFPFNSCVRSLLPFLLECEFPARFRRCLHSLFSAASYLPFASSLQKSLGFRRSWKKKNCFQISEQSADTKVKLTISTRGLIKHNLQSQNIKFTTTENILGLRRFAQTNCSLTASVRKN